MLGGLGQPPLVDEEGGLLLGARDDALRLFLRLLDDPLALGVDPLGGPDLLGDGDAQLVDEPERGVLVDDDVRRERQLLAVRDERFEALDEEDDVDGVPSGWRRVRRRARLWHAASRVSDGRAPRRERRRARPPGPSPETSPPNDAISLTRLELT